MKKNINPNAPKLKVGDKVAYYSGFSFRKSAPLKIMTVERVTATLAICGEAAIDRVPITRRPASAEEIATVSANDARKRQEREDAEKAAAARAADPRLSLADRLQSGGDFHPWHKLTLEQLQQISAWFDAAEGKP